jgi:hypothetical protein
VRNDEAAHSEIERGEHLRILINEHYWEEKHHREREERDTQHCVAHASGIPESSRHAAIFVVLESLHRHLEECLREQIKQAAAERRQRNPEQTAANPEVHPGPDKEDDDTEVRQLKGQPHVGSACEHLKPAAQPLREIQQGGIDVKHFSSIEIGV